MTPLTRKEKLRFLLLMAVLLALWLWLRPGCPIRNLTGIPCPGCGMSRAWWSLLRLDIPGAFAHHPMFWAVPAFLWLYWREFRPFPRAWANIAVSGLLALGLVGCWGFRLYFGRIL